MNSNLATSQTSQLPRNAILADPSKPALILANTHTPVGGGFCEVRAGGAAAGSCEDAAQRPIANLDTETVPDPCLLCESDAAPRWLLCLGCAASLTNDDLERLRLKYLQLQSWLPRSEAMLNQMRPDDPRRETGYQVWSRKLRIYERIAQLGRAVKAGAA